jgi:peptide/nickel transport system ATP-binding protein
VEWGDGEQVSSNPQHPYTKRLMMAAPVPNPVEQAVRREERRALLAAGII